MTDAGTHRLVATLHELLKAVRLLKQGPAPHSTVTPVGTAGVLSEIRRREASGTCHAKELAAENLLDPSTVSRAVAGLVRAGLVARAADPADGRASTLRLTEQGNTVLDDVHGYYENRLAEALRHWSPVEIENFTAALHRFVGDLITSAPASAPASDSAGELSTPTSRLEAAR
jgi:DNA-binding MarR family transcriptional regulator